MLEVSQLRALVALIEESSVSRAASRLEQSQPQMSATLRRLREILGDPLLVRSGSQMLRTARAQELVQQARKVLDGLQALTAPPAAFDPARMARTWSIAIPDFVGADLLGAIIGAIRTSSPSSRVQVLTVQNDADGRSALANGKADLLIESGLIRAADIRYTLLFDDNVLSVAARKNGLVKGSMDLPQYLALPHVAASLASGLHPGMIDRMLAARGFSRKVVAWVPYFNALPRILAQSDLVLTTAGHVAYQFAQQADLQVFAPPIKLPRIRYYAMWHERFHPSAELRWIRSLLRGAIERQLGRRKRG